MTDHERLTPEGALRETMAAVLRKANRDNGINGPLFRWPATQAAAILAALPDDAALVTTESLAEALHIAAPASHHRQKCRDRHDIRAAAIIAAAKETP